MSNQDFSEEILDVYYNGLMTIEQIAERYNVSIKYVLDLIFEDYGSDLDSN